VGVLSFNPLFVMAVPFLDNAMSSRQHQLHRPNPTHRSMPFAKSHQTLGRFLIAAAKKLPNSTGGGRFHGRCRCCGSKEGLRRSTLTADIGQIWHRRESEESSEPSCCLLNDGSEVTCVPSGLFASVSQADGWLGLLK
jgi:hypothetical protein